MALPFVTGLEFDPQRYPTQAPEKNPVNEKIKCVYASKHKERIELEKKYLKSWRHYNICNALTFGVWDLFTPPPRRTSASDEFFYYMAVGVLAIPAMLIGIVTATLFYFPLYRPAFDSKEEIANKLGENLPNKETIKYFPRVAMGKRIETLYENGLLPKELLEFGIDLREKYNSLQDEHVKNLDALSKRFTPLTLANNDAYVTEKDAIEKEYATKQRGLFEQWEQAYKRHLEVDAKYCEEKLLQKLKQRRISYIQDELDETQKRINSEREILANIPPELSTDKRSEFIKEHQRRLASHENEYKYEVSKCINHDDRINIQDFVNKHFF